MDMEDRVKQLEIDTAVIRHDVNNMRMSVTGLETKLDKLQTDIMARIDRLQASIFRIGLSIICAILMLLVSMVGYFIVQKDNNLQKLSTSTTTQYIPSR